MKINSNKLIKYAIIFFIAYHVIAAIFTIVTGYSINFNGDINFCKSFFKERYQDELDTLSVVLKRKSDFIANCHNKNYTYVYRIQEIHDLNHIDLTSIQFKYNVDLDHIKFYPAQGVDDDKDYTPTIISYWNQTYGDTLRVSFGRETKLDTLIRDKKKIIIYGHIDKMLFSDDDYDERMLYDYKDIDKTMVLFIKREKKLYIIIINAFPPHKLGMEALDFFKDF
jgi:hypothetical protein